MQVIHEITYQPPGVRKIQLQLPAGVLLSSEDMIENLLRVRLRILRLLKISGRAPANGVTYREFRAVRIAEMAEPVRGGTGKTTARGAVRGRTVIANFRKHVDSHDLGRVWKSNADPAHLARALRIPEFIPVFPSAALKGAVMLATSAMSERNKVLAAARLLDTIRTSEGRRYAYQSLLYLLCGQPDLHREYCKHLSDELAYLLSEFDGFDSPKQLHALALFPLPLLRAGKRLGLHSPGALLEELRPLRRGVSANGVFILAEEGVLTSGFSPVLKYVKTDDFHHLDEVAQLEEFRDTVRILQRAGVAPDTLVAVLHQTWQLAPAKLELSIELLAYYGVTDVNTIYGALGQLLWTLNRDVLRFLLAEVGIRDGAVLGKMDQLLRQRHPPAMAVVNALLEHVENPAELAEVQTFIIGVSGAAAQPVHRIGYLLGAPHGLEFAELNRCTAYLTNDVGSEVKFMGFLQVLLQHGLGNSRGILQFQKCFVATRSAETVDNYIRLARRHVPAIADDMLAAFVEQALAVRSPTSLRYLLDDSQVAIADMKDLDKLIRLAAVSPDVLRYLVQERRMTTAALLGRWFYEEAEGVQDYYGAETYGALERVLFADCSRRKAFFRLYQNMQCVYDAFSQYASARAPVYNPDWNEEQRSAYRAALEKYGMEARLKAVPFLRPILERTEGIVLASALKAAIEGRDLRRTLDALEPMLGSLLSGRGPTATALSSMEAEAVGLVYGVARYEVESHWHKVQGCEHHLDSVQLEERYPMVWSKKRYSLPNFTHAQAQAQLSNFGALASAAARARQMQTAEDPASLAGRFRTKPLADSAATAPALSDWLALLLYSCVGEVAVRSWLDHTLESYVDFLDRPQEAHKRILALQTFMATTLSDALSDNLNKFVEHLSDRMVAELCRSLAFLCQTQASSPGREQLCVVLRALADKVLGVFNKWIATLQQRFESEKKDLPDVMHVSGIVTKHPAAFYCRYKFGLCTRADTDMWQEARHSHMLVFDDARKSLVGMAMVYVQPIEGYYGGKQCLVIRAINIRSPDDIQLDAGTAIDEIMRVATDIARKNGYSAVLFPRDSTFFSNQSFVVKASHQARSTSKAQSISSGRSAYAFAPASRTLFWCKTQGASDGAVGELFTAWTSGSDTVEHKTGRTAHTVD